LENYKIKSQKSAIYSGSKFGLLLVFIFILLSLLGRFLFPFGDEPDWEMRVSWLLNGVHPFWSPYLWFHGLISSFQTDTSLCTVEAGAKSVWGFIPSDCNEDLLQSVYRWLLTVFICFPLLLIITFRNAFIRAMNTLRLRRTRGEWNKRLDAIALSLIFPGMLYYLGVFAGEHFYVVAALYLFLFSSFAIPIIFLLIIISSIDFGNSLVAIFFVLTLTYFNLVSRKNSKFYLYGSAFLLVIFALFIGYSFLNLITQLSFLVSDSLLIGKAESMYSSLEDGYYVTKYPVLLRPAITFMAFIFLTPSGLKIPLLYIFYAVAFLYIFYKTYKSNNMQIQVFLLTSIVTILFFVFLFPTYANAKYYIFMFPFIVYVALNHFTKNKIFGTFLLSSLFVFLNLILFRL